MRRVREFIAKFVYRLKLIKYTLDKFPVLVVRYIRRIRLYVGLASWYPTYYPTTARGHLDSHLDRNIQYIACKLIAENFCRVYFLLLPRRPFRIDADPSSFLDKEANKLPEPL